MNIHVSPTVMYCLLIIFLYRNCNQFHLKYISRTYVHMYICWLLALAMQLINRPRIIVVVFINFVFIVFISFVFIVFILYLSNLSNVYWSTRFIDQAWNEHNGVYTGYLWCILANVISAFILRYMLL